LTHSTHIHSLSHTHTQHSTKLIEINEIISHYYYNNIIISQHYYNNNIDRNNNNYSTTTTRTLLQVCGLSLLHSRTSPGMRTKRTNSRRDTETTDPDR
jgi:hypothetical protein